MRKGLAIFFVVLMLLQGLDLLVEGLAMLPSMVDHYQIHHHHSHDLHGEDLSFFSFFCQHYIGMKHHDDDGGDHSNLPFSHAGKITGDFEINFIKSNFMPCIVGAWDENSGSEFSWSCFYSHLYMQDIFRPPLA